MTPAPTSTERVLRHAVYGALGRHDERIGAVQHLLALSVDAGDADLWGNTIRHAAVRAALSIADSNRCDCPFITGQRHGAAGEMRTGLASAPLETARAGDLSTAGVPNGPIELPPRSPR